MMHTSTSPQYLMVASLDVATKMMEGAPGRALMDDAIGEALAFRREIVTVRDQMAEDLELVVRHLATRRRYVGTWHERG